MDRQASKRKVACRDVKCPVLSSRDKTPCAECPGPDFFTRHHECRDRNGDCRFFQKGDPRCLICPGPSDEPSHKGASHVGIDATVDAGNRLLCDRVGADEENEAAVASIESVGEEALMAERLEDARPSALALSEECADVARKLLGFFMALEMDEFALVKHIMNGGNLNTYALANNTRRQYVWKMAKKMIAKSPELRAIIRERKQPNGRRKSAADRFFQMTLF